MRDLPYEPTRRNTDRRMEREHGVPCQKCRSVRTFANDAICHTCHDKAQALAAADTLHDAAAALLA